MIEPGTIAWNCDRLVQLPWKLRLIFDEAQIAAIIDAEIDTVGQDSDPSWTTER